MSERTNRLLHRLLRLLPVVAVLAPALFVATAALARPGGGHSFSGGGHSGGGGGGGGGDGLGLIIWLLIRYPKVGIPVAVVAFVWWTMKRSHEGKRRDWATSIPSPARPVTPRRALDRIRELDPDFSTVLFEDFLYALYAKAHEARGRGELDVLSAYLGENARGTLKSVQPKPSEVKGVVVGAMDLVAVSGLAPPADRIGVTVRFETNYTEAYPDRREQTWYVVEQWNLARGRSVRSRPPDRSRVFDCPNCGAALEPSPDGVCAYCQTRVDTGDFDWVVSSIVTFERTPQGPNLTTTVRERGTDNPTVRDLGLGEGLAALQARDPAFDVSAFEARVGRIHHEINDAWSTRKWELARPWVSDALFETQLYWIEAYRRAHLRNVTEKARVTRMELCAISSDRWYDALTVRVFATGLDYTISDDGRLVAGSRSRERPYSEYWTLIRAKDTSGVPKSDPICPNCGAPLDKINMAGVCEYCGAKVTTGEFDWVLSRIEQDDVYGI